MKVHGKREKVTTQVVAPAGNVIDLRISEKSHILKKMGAPKFFRPRRGRVFVEMVQKPINVRLLRSRKSGWITVFYKRLTSPRSC